LVYPFTYVSANQWGTIRIITMSLKALYIWGGYVIYLHKDMFQ
jgi:hypothetical protein